MLYDGGNCRRFSTKAIKKSKAPVKVCFFASAATNGNILMEDMLKRIYFNGPKRCFMCLQEEATMDDLLIHYRWAFILLAFISFLMGVNWVSSFFNQRCGSGLEEKNEE